MADRYQQLINTPIGRIVSKQVGLPAPVRIDRFEPGQPVINGPVLLGGAPFGRLIGPAMHVLAGVGAETHTPMLDEVRSAAADAGVDARVFNPEVAAADQTFKALVFDATGITSTDALHEAWAFFHPTIRRVRTSGRVIVLGTPPEDAGAPPEAIAQRALEGLVRSIGKEVRNGRDGAARLRRPVGGAGRRVDAALPALAEVGVRLGPGHPGRPRRLDHSGRQLGPAARREGRARHRRLPRDRRGDRRGPRPGRRPRRRRRRARDGRGTVEGHRAARRLVADGGHHRRGRARGDRHAPARGARRRRHRRPQRRHHPRQDARPDER